MGELMLYDYVRKYNSQFFNFIINDLGIFLREHLIVRENIQLSMKNLEIIDEQAHLKDESEGETKFANLGGRKKK